MRSVRHWYIVQTRHLVGVLLETNAHSFPMHIMLIICHLSVSVLKHSTSVGWIFSVDGLFLNPVMTLMSLKPQEHYSTWKTQWSNTPPDLYCVPHPNNIWPAVVLWMFLSSGGCSVMFIQGIPDCLVFFGGYFHLNQSGLGNDFTLKDVPDWVFLRVSRIYSIYSIACVYTARTRWNRFLLSSFKQRRLYCQTSAHVLISP